MQDRGNNQQQPVLLQDVGPPNELPYQQPECNRRSKTHVDHAEPAEEVERARHVAQKKSDRHEIEKYPERTRNVVVRFAVLPMVVLNGYFTNRGSIGRSYCRNETVHFAIER